MRASKGCGVSGAVLSAATRAAMTVASRDLRAEMRTRSAVQGLLAYTVLAVLLFSFALGPDSETLRRFAPGLLWLALALGSLLLAGRAFAVEREQGTLEALLLYPVPRESLLAGKILAAFVLLLGVGAVTLALMVFLYGLPTPRQPWLLAPGLVLGALGLAATGAFYGAVTARLRAREALVPMLVLPVLVPLLIAGTQVFTAAFSHSGGGGRWLLLLAAFDALVLILPSAVFPFVVEE